MPNHIIILYRLKTAVFRYQICFAPLEVPITNLSFPFFGLLHYIQKFCKMFLHRSSFSAFILIFRFETSDELTEYIGLWLTIKFVSCLVIILEFSSLNFAVMVYLIFLTILVMMSILFRYRSRFDHP